MKSQDFYAFIDDRGENNEIKIHPTANLKGECQIIIEGNDNKIYINEGAVLLNSKLKILSNENMVRIGNHTRIKAFFGIKVGNGNQIIIGEKTTIGGCRFICSESTKVIVGKDCMFGSMISLRTTDSHPIYDGNNVRLNVAKDIFIGDHVWIADGVTLLKGSKISNGSVVALNSVVTHRYGEENVVVAGNPSRIVKHGIYWSRQHVG